MARHRRLEKPLPEVGTLGAGLDKKEKIDRGAHLEAALRATWIAVSFADVTQNDESRPHPGPAVSANGGLLCS